MTEVLLLVISYTVNGQKFSLSGMSGQNKDWYRRGQLVVPEKLLRRDLALLLCTFPATRRCTKWCSEDITRGKEEKGNVLR